MKKSKNTNRRGFIFIYAYLLIVLFMVYELALLTYFAQNINAFERFSNNTIAYQLAEAGLDSAMAKLKNNQIVFDANGNYTETRDFILGNYNVTVSNQQEDLDGDGASDGPLAPNTFRITTLASAPAVSNPARPIQQATNVVAFVRKEEKPLFEYAAFGTEGISFGDGTYIRSAPSGTNWTDYGNGLSVSDPYGGYKLQQYGHRLNKNGDIGTDSVVQGAVSAGGLSWRAYRTPEADIGGNAIIGPGGDPDAVIPGSMDDGNRSDGQTEGSIVHISGTVNAVEAPKDYQPITTTIPLEPRRNLGTQNELYPLAYWQPSSSPFNPNKFVFPEGKYHFEQFQLPQNAELVTIGKVEIYVDGGMFIPSQRHPVGPPGALINKSGSPSDLTFYVGGRANVGSTSDALILGRGRVHIGEAAHLCGVIYAPNSEVYIGADTDVGGSVIGKQVETGLGVDIVYDESLKDAGGGQGTEMNLVSWRTVPIETNSADSSS